LIYEINSIPVEQFRVHPNASIFARKKGLERLAIFFKKICYLNLIQALSKWVKVIRLKIAWEISRLVIHQMAASRLTKVSEVNVAMRLNRSFTKFRLVVNAIRKFEKLAASCEIQRCVRGGLCRISLKKRIKFFSVVLIQSVVRRLLAKKTLKQMQHLKKLKFSVKIIEKLWLANKWKRVMLKIFRYNLSMRNALKIQKIYRGHLGKKKFKRTKLYAKQLTGCIKFQSTWRRYKSCIKVESIRSKALKNSAAVINFFFFSFYFNGLFN
jgi:hypothetical protein